MRRISSCVYLSLLFPSSMGRFEVVNRYVCVFSSYPDYIRFFITGDCCRSFVQCDYNDNIIILQINKKNFLTLITFNKL